MKQRAVFIVLLILIVSAAGCTLTQVRHTARKPVYTAPSNIAFDDSQEINRQIQLQYQQWKGTRYAYGGLSRNGIDCSGFVYVTYLDKFGIKLPRSTSSLSQVGRKVKRAELRPGDLVFFKTGFKGRHVGIYMDKGRFVHASTKKGVMISSFRDYYWKNKYWTSRRVVL